MKLLWADADVTLRLKIRTWLLFMWDLGPFLQVPVVYKVSDQYSFTVYYRSFKSVHDKIKLVTSFFPSLTTQTVVKKRFL